MRTLLVLSASLAAALVGAVPASAAITRSVFAGPPAQVTLESDGAADTILLTCVGGMAQNESVNIVPCADVATLRIRGNDGNDVIDLSNITSAEFPALRTIDITGGNGTDTVRGTQLGDEITADNLDTISGNGGDDVIEGGAIVFGGDGDDVMTRTGERADGGPGDDRFETPNGLGPYAGGPGKDTWTFDLPAATALAGELRFVLDDTGTDLRVSSPLTEARIAWSDLERVELRLINDGTQVVDGSRFSGDLHVEGRGGPDTIIGGPGEDFLYGGVGDDDIDGGPGFDYVDGGPGADTLRLRDGQADRGVCGDGLDSVIADAVDILTGCEALDVPPVPPPPPPPVVQVPVEVAPIIPPDRTAPRLTLAKPRLVGRRLSFTARCPTTEVRCIADATVRITGRRGRSKKTTRVTLGRIRATIPGGTTRTLSRTVTTAQLRSLRRLNATKLALSIVVTDASANRRTQTASPKITVPKR